MPRAEKRFILKKEESRAGTKYILLDNGVADELVNQWIACKSIRKISTGREYAGKLAFYLNFERYFY